MRGRGGRVAVAVAEERRALPPRPTLLVGDLAACDAELAALRADARALEEAEEAVAERGGEGGDDGGGGQGGGEDGERRVRVCGRRGAPAIAAWGC